MSSSLAAWDAFYQGSVLQRVIPDPLLALVTCVATVLYVLVPAFQRLLASLLPVEPAPTAASSRVTAAAARPSGSKPRERGERSARPASSRGSTSGRAADAAAREALRARAGNAAALFGEGGASGARIPPPVRPPVAPPPPPPAAPARPSSRGGFRSPSPDGGFSFPSSPQRSDTPELHAPGARPTAVRARRNVAFAPDSPPAAPRPPRSPPWPARKSAPSLPPSPLHGPAPSWEEELRAELAQEKAERGAAAQAMHAQTALRERRRAEEEEALRGAHVAAMIADAEALALAQREEALAAASAECAAAAAEAARAAVDDAAAAAHAAALAAEVPFLPEEGPPEVPPAQAGPPALTPEQAEMHAIAAACERADALRAFDAAATAAFDTEVAALSTRVTYGAIATVLSRHAGREAWSDTLRARKPRRDDSPLQPMQLLPASLLEAHQRPPPLPPKPVALSRSPSPVLAALPCALPVSPARQQCEAAAQVAAAALRTLQYYSLRRDASPSPEAAAESPRGVAEHERAPESHEEEEALAAACPPFSASRTPSPRRRLTDMLLRARSRDATSPPPARPDVPKLSFPVAAAPSAPATPQPQTTPSTSPRSEGGQSFTTRSRAASLTELALAAKAADGDGCVASPPPASMPSPRATPPPSPPLERRLSSRSLSPRPVVRTPGTPHYAAQPPAPAPEASPPSLPVSLLRPEEADALGQLRIVLRLPQEPPHSPLRRFCSDAMLARYLRAKRWHVDAAARAVSRTLAWRLNAAVEGLTWAHVSSLGVDCGAAMRLDVRDRHGRPVLCLRPGRVQQLDARTVQLLSYTMEAMVRSMDTSDCDARGAGVDLSSEQVLLLVDCTDWSLRAAPGRLAVRKCLKLLTRHYPERLGTALVLNPPRLFSLLWAAVCPFLDARTTSKIHIMSASQPLRQRELMALYFEDLSRLEVSLGGDGHDLTDDLTDVEAYARRMVEEDATFAPAPPPAPAPQLVAAACDGGDETETETETDAGTEGGEELEAERAAAEEESLRVAAEAAAAAAAAEWAADEEVRASLAAAAQHVAREAAEEARAAAQALAHAQQAEAEAEAEIEATRVREDKARAKAERDLHAQAAAAAAMDKAREKSRAAREVPPAAASSPHMEEVSPPAASPPDSGGGNEPREGSVAWRRALFLKAAAATEASPPSSSRRRAHANQ